VSDVLIALSAIEGAVVVTRTSTTSRHPGDPSLPLEIVLPPEGNVIDSHCHIES